MPATRADPDWLRYLSARVTSVAGSSATLVALPVLVYRLTGSALLTGVISGAESLPYLLFGLVAGTLADRRNRRSMMIAVDLASAAVVGSVPLAAAAGVLGGPQVVTVAALLGVLFVQPIRAYLTAQDELRDARAELAEARLHKERAVAERDALGTREMLVREARRRGYIFPGETPFSVGNR